MKKQELISLLLLIFCVMILLSKGVLFNLLIYALAMISLWEFLCLKATKKNVPLFIKFVSYMIMTFMIVLSSVNDNHIYSIDIRLIACLFMLLLIPTVLYKRETYSVNDAFYLIGSILFLSMSLSIVILVKSINLNLLIYLVLITFLTDTYAFIIGSLIGKYKIVPHITSSKTLEGTLGGTFFGTVIPTIYYVNIINPAMFISQVLCVTLFLSILSQLGSLVFISIKNYYQKKDFAFLFKNYGGILDRLDSFLFVVLGYMFVFTFI